MTRPQLFGRSASHFTRVARMVAIEAGVDLDFRVILDIKSLDAEAYGGHPALKLPTLVLGEERVFGSTTICRRLVQASPAGFTLTWPEAMSPRLQTAWELLSQAMTSQVQLAFGVTVTGLPVDHLFFVKAAKGLDGAMTWLDERLPDLLAELPPGLSLFEIALFCQLEHLRFRPTAGLRQRPNLDAFQVGFATRPSAMATPCELDSPGAGRMA
ncbi:MAG TPA: glutathione S-transferase family protein [Caulobacter sp.]|nr:glutathione S-transferase family protein [Caulobacter sp.]